MVRLHFKIAVRVVFPEIVPEVAVMVAVPAATAVTTPLLLTVATDGFDELQVTCVAIRWLVPSEYVPVAVNWRVTPSGMLGLAGVTTMENRGEATVRTVSPEMLPEVAVIVAVPAAILVTNPLSLTVATDGFDELQVTCMVISIIPPE